MTTHSAILRFVDEKFKKTKNFTFVKFVLCSIYFWSYKLQRIIASTWKNVLRYWCNTWKMRKRLEGFAAVWLESHEWCGQYIIIIYRDMTQTLHPTSINIQSQSYQRQHPTPSHLSLSLSSHLWPWINCQLRLMNSVWGSLFHLSSIVMIDSMLTTLCSLLFLFYDRSAGEGQFD